MPARFYLITFYIFFVALSVRGQVKSFDLYELTVKGQLVVLNRGIKPLQDAKFKGTRLSAHEGDGVAWLAGSDFSNGTIEADIRGKDVAQQSFVGIAFHGINRDSLEAVYFRPFNFLSTDSAKKSHCVEYVSHPGFPWERLRKEHPGEFEKGVHPPPKPDEWFHIKIQVHYPEVKVYVNGNTVACLTVRELSDRASGKIGLWVGNNSDGDFANLTITSK